MPILMAPSARASENRHTCEGGGIKANTPLDTAPSLEKTQMLQEQGLECWLPVQGPATRPEPEGLPRASSQAQESSDMGGKQSSQAAEDRASRSQG